VIYKYELSKFKRYLTQLIQTPILLFVDQINQHIQGLKRAAANNRAKTRSVMANHPSLKPAQTSVVLAGSGPIHNLLEEAD